MWRRPICGRHGRAVVAFLCGWELAALCPGSPLPTLSQVARKQPVVAYVLLGGLAHHWLLEVTA